MTDYNLKLIRRAMEGGEAMTCQQIHDTILRFTTIQGRPLRHIPTVAQIGNIVCGRDFKFIGAVSIKGKRSNQWQLHANPEDYI